MKYLLTLVILILIFACKTHNKKKVSGNESVETPEFFEAYNNLKLPFTIADTNFEKYTDTAAISYQVFTQFVSDTIFNNPFGKNRKLTIHPIGKIEQKGKESYFVTLVSDKDQSAAYLSVYDKNKFIISMLLLVSNDDEYTNTATIDNKLSIIINKDWTVKNDLYYKRTIYAYNNVGIFTKVLTETNEERSAEAAVLNPLDTFPKKYKYSGDYVKGKKSFLFLRDGKTPGEYLFFVHFTEEDKEEPCGGELKGRIKMASDKAGKYSGPTDPCVLDFSFATTEIKVKETGSCGNYRGIKCFFNDTYIKKKEPKAAVRKKQTK